MQDYHTPHFYGTCFSLRTNSLYMVCFFKGKIYRSFIHRSCHKDDDDDYYDGGGGCSDDDDDDDDDNN